MVERRDRTQFATRAVHAGLDPDPSFGSVVPAIHQSSTYIQPSPGESAAGYGYSRSANPTRSALERALGGLEGGLATAFSSGMAAGHALITAICGAGDHVILGSELHGSTFRLVDKILGRWGLVYDIVDQTDPDAIAAAIRPETKLVWIATPTNPLLNVVDIPSVVERAGEVPVCVDNTFATPAVQRPIELGARAVVHSTATYLGGHADVAGGAVIVADPELHERVRFVQRSGGAVPGPLDCFLVHRGLRTLHLRVQAHTASGRAVSEFLRKAEGVRDVRWPGFGGMVSFRHPEASQIAAATRIFAAAESLAGVASLVHVPRAMTHHSVEGSVAAVPSDLVRLSCGVEAPDDLVADLARALSAASAAAELQVGGRT